MKMVEMGLFEELFLNKTERSESFNVVKHILLNLTIEIMYSNYTLTNITGNDKHFSFLISDPFDYMLLVKN